MLNKKPWKLSQMRPGEKVNGGGEIFAAVCFYVNLNIFKLYSVPPVSRLKPLFAVETLARAGRRREILNKCQ